MLFFFGWGVFIRLEVWGFFLRMEKGIFVSFCCDLFIVMEIDKRVFFFLGICSCLVFLLGLVGVSLMMVIEVVVRVIFIGLYCL